MSKTPEEIANEIVDEWFRLPENSTHLKRRIAAALEAATAKYAALSPVDKAIDEVMRLRAENARLRAEIAKHYRALGIVADRDMERG